MIETSTKDGTAVDALLDKLASGTICPEIQGLTVTFQLDVDDVGRRYVIVGDHDITISRGPTEADCALGYSATDFVRMMEGTLNPLAAFLRGRVRVAGNLSAAASFGRLLPIQQ
jgi:putative sterol carrier protein